jgi:hypothetical protein
LRDVNNVRVQIGQTSLTALAHRLGYRTHWRSKNKTKHWSHANLQHLCRSALVDRVVEYIKSQHADITAEFGGRRAYGGAYRGPLVPARCACVSEPKSAQLAVQLQSAHASRLISISNSFMEEPIEGFLFWHEATELVVLSRAGLASLAATERTRFSLDFKIDVFKLNFLESS